MSLGSGQFSSQNAVKQHLLRGSGGIQAEVADLRADIKRDFAANAAVAVEEFTNVPVADVDAIKTSIASSASPVSYSGAALNGVIGAGAISPPRNITITTTTHADIDAVVVVVTGTDINGDALTENITLTDGGGVTDAGLKAFASVEQVDIPAQGGTGGALTIGFGARIGLGKPLLSRAGLAAVLLEVSPLVPLRTQQRKARTERTRRPMPPTTRGTTPSSTNTTLLRTPEVADVSHLLPAQHGTQQAYQVCSNGSAYPSSAASTGG